MPSLRQAQMVEMQFALMAMGALQKQATTIGGVLKKAEETLAQTKSKVTSVLDYVHKESATDVQHQLCKIQTDSDTRIKGIHQKQADLTQRVVKQGHDLY